MPYSKSFWGVDDSGSWVLVAIARRRRRRRRVVVAIAAAAAVKQGKRLRINIASFILNEAGFTAAHPPKHSPPHGAPPLCAEAVRRRRTTARLAALRRAAAALKYIYGCCKRAVGSLTQVSAALLSTDHAAVARESNNEQVVTK